MEWQCSDWSSCINGFRTRTCSFVKVPQHTQETQCLEESKSPVTNQTCEAFVPTPITAFAVSNETEQALETKTAETNQSNLTTESQATKKTGLNAITGAIATVFTNPNAVRELIIGASVLVIIILVFLGYKFVYKRKKI